MFSLGVYFSSQRFIFVIFSSLFFQSRHLPCLVQCSLHPLGIRQLQWAKKQFSHAALAISENTRYELRFISCPLYAATTFTYFDLNNSFIFARYHRPQALSRTRLLAEISSNARKCQGKNANFLLMKWRRVDTRC